MSDRDRQNPYGRNPQQGSGNRWEGYDSPSQANQWQVDGDRQQGGDYRGSGQRGGFDDDGRDYRFSGQGENQDRSSASSQGRYRSQMNDESLRSDQRDASRNYERARGGYGQYSSSGAGSQDRQQRDRQASYYAGRDYDASGGNDFGNFTSEDYGGRDFYNRDGGAVGGARSSESYRPSYGIGSWFNDDDDDRQRGRRQGQTQSRGREDYGSWRQYGESRGFLERAGDEIASWFGSEDASRRRDQDHRADAGSNQGQNHRGRGPSNYTRSDDRIREDANDHLTHDWGVDATNITVSVKDGELTLDGTVESRQAKRRAEDAVEHISGVKHVQNNLRVQERSSSYGATGSSATSGSSFGQGPTSYSGGTGSTATSSTGTASALSGQSSDADSSRSTTSGASTTSGIGSTAGAGGATTSRSGDKTT